MSHSRNITPHHTLPPHLIAPHKRRPTKGGTHQRYKRQHLPQNKKAITLASPPRPTSLKRPSHHLDSQLLPPNPKVQRATRSPKTKRQNSHHCRTPKMYAVVIDRKSPTERLDHRMKPAADKWPDQSDGGWATRHAWDMRACGAESQSG